MSRLGIEPGPPWCRGGEHSTRKEPLEQLDNSYPEHSHMSAQTRKMLAKYNFYFILFCKGQDNVNTKLF
jgi:hypothetical protein